MSAPKSARLFTAYLALVVTVKTRDGRNREESATKRLALVAHDDADARERAIAWLNEQPSLPGFRHSFGRGAYSECIAVRLATSQRPHFDPVTVHESADGIEVIS